MQICLAEFLVGTKDVDAETEAEAETEANGSVIKCLQFYFPSFALSNLNDKWRRQQSEGDCNVARPATLTLALTFCLSRVHVITEPSPKTQE